MASSSPVLDDADRVGAGCRRTPHGTRGYGFGFVSHSFDGDAERFDAAAQLFSHCGFQEPDHANDNLFRIERLDAGCQGRLVARHQASLVAKY